jgi:DNA-binding transcriptional regulator YbjK
LRLDTPELAAALEGEVHDEEQAANLSEQIAADTTQLHELAGMWAEREIDANEWRAARAPIEQRRDQAERRLAGLRRHRTVAQLFGQADRLRAEWSSLNLDRQRAIVAAILDHVIVHRYSLPGKARFDPNRFVPVWRL